MTERSATNQNSLSSLPESLQGGHGVCGWSGSIH